jgi:hypothetical protein
MQYLIKVSVKGKGIGLGTGKANQAIRQYVNTKTFGA